MMLEAGIYVRRSDKLENFSPRNQTDRCLEAKIYLARQFGQAINVAPEHVYVDEGVSGKDFDRRGYLQLRAAIERGEIKLLIVNDITRLGRTPDPTDMFNERKFCIEHGVRVWLVKENLEITDQSQGAIIQFFFGALFAGRQRLDGMWASEQGKKKALELRPEAISHGGQPPLGYRSVKGVITPDEERLPALLYLFELGAKGMTAEDIALAFNRQGIPAPRGKQWHTNTVRRILANPIYRGDGMIVNYTDPDTHEPAQTVYPAPALVDPETFAAAQRQAAIRQRTRKVARSMFWLSGKAICGSCGQHFNGFSNNKEHARYYRCDGRGQWKRWDYPAPCTMPIVTARRLEEPIWDDIRLVLSDPSILMAALADRPNEAQIARELERIAQSIKEHQRQIGRLRDGWAAQVFTPDEIGAGVAQHRAEIDTLETERMGWEWQQLVLQRQGPAEINLDNLPAEAKAALAQQMIDHIDIQQVGPKAIQATVFYFLLPDSAAGQGRHNLSTGAMLPLTVARPVLEISC